MRQANHASTTRRALVSGLAAAIPTVAVAGTAAAVSSPELEGEITRLFGQWQRAVDAVWAASEEEFRAAFDAEHGLRLAMKKSQAVSLRELQMQAYAFTADGCGYCGLAEGERAVVNAREWLERHPATAHDRVAAFTFAVTLMRLAEADPNGPRPPTIPPREKWHPEQREVA
jgi:hypothetical protein